MGDIVAIRIISYEGRHPVSDVLWLQRWKWKWGYYGSVSWKIVLWFRGFHDRCHDGCVVINIIVLVCSSHCSCSYVKVLWINLTTVVWRGSERYSSLKLAKNQISNSDLFIKFGVYRWLVGSAKCAECLVFVFVRVCVWVSAHMCVFVYVCVCVCVRVCVCKMQRGKEAKKLRS